MKTNLLRNLLCLALGLCGAVAAVAGPLQRTDVPAQPTWVLHINFDQLRPTTVGQYLMAEMSKPEADSKFAAFQSIFSFDPRTALHGVTLFSLPSGPKDGVMVVYADFDPERLTTLAKAANEYQASTYRVHTIHSWIDQKKPAVDGVRPRTYAAFHAKKVVFAQLQERLSEALDVLDATTPSLASSKAFPELGSPNGANFIEAAGRKMELPTADPNAAVFRMSEQIRFELGESVGQVKAAVVLDAKDEEVAGHIASIGQGLISLMKLQTEKPNNVKLAEAMSLKQDGLQVMVNVAMPATSAVEIMKAGAARKAAQ